MPNNGCPSINNLLLTLCYLSALFIVHIIVDHKIVDLPKLIDKTFNSHQEYTIATSLLSPARGTKNRPAREPVYFSYLKLADASFTPAGCEYYILRSRMFWSIHSHLSRKAFLMRSTDSWNVMFSSPFSSLSMGHILWLIRSDSRISSACLSM